jgi:hypothetical protein
LFELTTGQRPFTGETEYQVLNQIVNDDAPPPSSLVPGYPPHLERIVLKALARDPDQRYATAVALQADVEDFAHESRLRISPLVLGRVMGTLFPARLEEWDHAKSQGAFFLEQHVVRTLIESKQSFDDDATTSARQHRYVDPDTAVTAAPVEPTFDRDDASFDRAREITQLPHRDSHMPWDHSSVEIPATPEPPPPQRYPMVSDLMSAMPGSLVTAAGKYGGLPTSDIGKAADPTERVRVPVRRVSTPTAFVRTRSRTPLVMIIGLLGVAGAVAAVIALRGGDKPVRHEPSPPHAVEMQPEPVTAAAQDPAAAPAPVDATPTTIVRPPPTALPGETTTPVKPRTAPKPKPPAKH